MWVQSLGREDPLEEEIATCSNILAQKTGWTEKPGGLRSMGSQRVRYNWGAEKTHTHTPKGTFTPVTVYLTSKMQPF